MLNFSRLLEWEPFLSVFRLPPLLLLLLLVLCYRLAD